MSDHNIKIATNSSGVKLYYRASDHKYWTDDIDDFTSGTRFLHNFFPPFEADRMSHIMARKENKTVSAILQEWEDSNTTGNQVHYYGECLLNKDPLPEITTPKGKLMVKHLNIYIPKLLEHFELIETEKICFSVKLKLAGMMDILMRRKSDGRLFILDWKTVKKMRTRSFRSKKGFGPCRELDDSNYWHYVMQLNLYAHLLKEYHGYDEEITCSLIHITPEAITTYPVENKQPLVRRMIKDYLANMGGTT